MRAGALAGLLAAALAGSVAANPVIVGARFAEPTTRYDHGVLGDAVEYGALQLDLLVPPADGLGATARRKVTFRLPDTEVFEDIAPRLVDVTGDGAPEVVVVETSLTEGASLAIYSAAGKMAATPPLGGPHRWLAPLGAADLDGDGKVELALVDRPHAAKRLEVWRVTNGRLSLVATAPDLTAHRIGDTYISGGIRSCRTGPEIVLAAADWSAMMAVRLEGGKLVARKIGPWTGRKGLRRALRCLS